MVDFAGRSRVLNAWYYRFIVGERLQYCAPPLTAPTDRTPGFDLHYQKAAMFPERQSTHYHQTITGINAFPTSEAALP